jgi:ribonuclease PH
MDRTDGRAEFELRAIKLERGVNKYAEGSAFVEWGGTKVICTATVEDKAPPFLRGTGRGWISAEYAMLPRATEQRNQRDVNRGKLNGRGSEIQRLIGRSLRAAAHLDRLGERTIWIDCDVIQADGGTRTASISAGFVALFDALRWMRLNKLTDEIPLRAQIGAVSVGKVDGEILLDLCYSEDSRAEVDANLVMTGAGNFIEIQGTGEGGTFSGAELEKIISLGRDGIAEIHALQREALYLSAAEEKLFDGLV